MPLARIRFGRVRKRDLDEAEDAVYGYLYTLRHNGQVHELFLSSTGGRFQACAEVPRHDSLERRCSPSSIAEELKRLVTVFGRRPEVTLLDAVPAKRTFDWRRARSLYLHPYTFDRRSPVYTPEFEEPVPLYLLPLKPEERRMIISWSELYRAHDQIWLDSGPLEIGAWREIADPRSKLAKKGRKICARIEKATGKPTYYYLTRYYARRSGEQERPCPLCGRRWAIRSDEDPGTMRFSDFWFRCERCRLVSHSAGPPAIFRG